uniref:Uncharacterized protein n=1 Tax=Arion vulgaris TaxID=1028688 RepID=A0A0B7BP55_9EUPU
MKAVSKEEGGITNKENMIKMMMKIMNISRNEMKYITLDNAGRKLYMLEHHKNINGNQVLQY